MPKMEEPPDTEIEYVFEAPPDDDLSKEFANVFSKFTQFNNIKRQEAQENNEDQQQELALVPVHDKNQSQTLAESKENKPDQEKTISKRKIKEITRMSVAELKQKVLRPELVEPHDITARDPVFLLQLKSVKNSVPIPRHWSSKRRYLQGKRGFEKPPFQLPDYIRLTGIQEMRDSIQEKDAGKSLKARTRERIQPKMGKMQMDYERLHDAFFKWQTKPNLTIHGDLYHEGKEFEKKYKKKPGELSNELRRALGMPSGPNAHRYPPPWLSAMKRHVPPPSYPYLKIPGLNCPFPDSAPDQNEDGDENDSESVMEQ